MEDSESFLDDRAPEGLENLQVPISGGALQGGALQGGVTHGGAATGSRSSTEPVQAGTVSATATSSSPRWGATTKLVIGLTLAAISAFLLIRFMNIVGPLVLAFMLAYLIYPLAEQARLSLRLPWRISVTLLFLVMVILFIGLIAVGGLAVVEQLQKLIVFLQNAVIGLPAFVSELTSRPLEIGPFTINTGLLDANAVAQQLLGIIQPVLTQAGSSIVSFASGTASVIGWMFFILLIAYFILSESGGFPNRLFKITIPGHDEDIRRLGMALNRIWEAFLRGQVAIVLITILVYSIVLGAYRVSFFFGLALLAGLGRFIPYVGPFVAWTTYGLVAFFQGHTVFGLSPPAYVLLVVGTAWLMDLFMDNYVMPRMMSNALRIHPAAVMVFALMALNLLGVVGVVLAAPVLATMKLFVDYIFAKLFDQDPWGHMNTIPVPSPLPPLFPVLRRRLSKFAKRR